MNIADLLRKSESRRTTSPGIVPRQGETTGPADPLLRLRARVKETLFRRLGNQLFDSDLSEEQLRVLLHRELDEILSIEATQLSAEGRHNLVELIGADIFGLGPIEVFLADPTITEVMVNGDDAIYIERGGRLHLTDARFLTLQHVRKVIEKIVASVGRRIDESSPLVDARLPDGSRVNAVLPPLAVDGPVLTVRKFAQTALSTRDLVAAETLTDEAVEFLETCVRTRRNILISGGTGSGKTTLLNVVSSFIPESERIVTIEDAVELRLCQRHVVRLEARPPNVEGRGQITIRDLMRNSLRMRPDRIVIGEVRGGEALDMLQAMNTGHEGSLSTLHANKPRDALSRLETMVLMAGLELPIRSIREQIASALDVIVHLSRMSDGTRRVTEIAEVTGMDGDSITLATLFALEPGHGDRGRVERGASRSPGALRPTGVPTRLTGQLPGPSGADPDRSDVLDRVFPERSSDDGGPR
jgi:pilus assembly protein CpaF